MGLYTALVANLLFPLQEKLKKHGTVAIRSAMDDSQWWPSERIEALQLERLRQLISHAEQFVPYYRDLFKKIGLTAADIQSLADLQRIPLLTKPIIRSNLESFKSEKAQHLARFNTGGSSGEPLIFFIGNERVSHDVAAKWRATRWWGVDIGDREIVVWGSPIELTAQDKVRQIRDRVMRTHLIPAFEMSEAKLDEFVATIRSFRPTMLFGYPSSISLIAKHAEKRGQIMNDLGIKVAFVTSERLYDHQRDDISRVFGCPVANGYGGRDAGFIAHECPQGGMHLTAEDIIVEIVDKEGKPIPKGQAGEVVVTHLATGEFPFIRYRTGDVAVLSTQSCACGRGLPMLDEIQGRTTDFVVAADGTIMHGLAVVYPIRDIPGIASFKVVQETLQRVVVQIVPGENCGSDVETRISTGIKARLGQSVDVEVLRVGDIPREKSGKYRYVQSLVAQN
jgi:phenylacetate-CoA ligase